MSARIYPIEAWYRAIDRRDKRRADARRERARQRYRHYYGCDDRGGAA